MYTKDKSHRITLRLNDNQFAFVRMNAEQLDVSPSDFLRMVINSSMFAWSEMNGNMDLNNAVGKFVSETKEKYEIMEGIGRENDEANKYNLVQH